MAWGDGSVGPNACCTHRNEINAEHPSKKLGMTAPVSATSALLGMETRGLVGFIGSQPSPRFGERLEGVR